MVTIKNILKAYGVHPYRIEQVSQRLYKVSDGHHVYALKHSRLTENTVAAWEHVYHQAYALQLSTILPVYLTRQSHLYVTAEDSYYYLTPWIPDHQPSYEQVIRDACEAIGEVHARTRRVISIDTASIISHFSDYQRKNAESYHALLKYVDRFERNRYMSPFELQVCTHFHVLVKVFAELDHHIGRFIDELESEHEWYGSLCHGHLALSHFRHHRQTYLLNWEQAAYDHPVVDLSRLLHSLTRHYDQQPTQLSDLFSAYNRYNPLKTSERHLLTIYLLDPSHYIALIDQYITNHNQQTMIKWTQLLEAAFRRIKLGLEWAELAEFTDDSSKSADESET
ncbi:phosphotransferase [Lentibacillus salinarum]|uniref:Phosphotransferase n=1 Tax=Lentibacillus salinarum TaxID=446820 RepID=A0ABW3ZXK1_9BACI